MADTSWRADTVTPTSNQGVPEALQVPTRKMPAGIQILLGLANLVVWLAIFPTYQILLPGQIGVFDPVNKVNILTLITFLGGISAIIANPLSGALSDHTTSRWGRRRPWAIAGALLAAASLVLMAQSTGVMMLGVGLVLFQFFINIDIASLAAIVPDQVPLRQRATVSAFVGVALPIGTVVGLVLVAQVIKSTQLSYYVLAGVLVVIIALFSLIVRDVQLPKGALPRLSFREFVAGFWINPVKHPDFALTLGGRILVIFGYYMTVIYMLYFLQDVVRYTALFPGQTIDQGVATYQLISTGVLLFSIFISGVVSDKLQRRKPFVVCASVLVAGALGILAFFSSWTAVIAAACVMGAGFGMFLSVDLALQTQVLPKDSNRGKDLGILNTANLFPQVLVPFFAVFALSIFHSYSTLFLIGAISALVGAALILPIKGVR